MVLVPESTKLLPLLLTVVLEAAPRFNDVIVSIPAAELPGAELLELLIVDAAPGPAVSPKLARLAVTVVLYGKLRKAAGAVTVAIGVIRDRGAFAVPIAPEVEVTLTVGFALAKVVNFNTLNPDEAADPATPGAKPPVPP